MFRDQVYVYLPSRCPYGRTPVGKNLGNSYRLDAAADTTTTEGCKYREAASYFVFERWYMALIGIHWCI